MINAIKYRLKDIALLQFSIFILSLTSIIAKKASTYPFLSMDFAGLYILLVFIIGVYAISWQQILKKFELTIAYINKGALFIWTFLWAVIFFNEKITFNNVFGVFIIMAGVLLVLTDD